MSIRLSWCSLKKILSILEHDEVLIRGIGSANISSDRIARHHYLTTSDGSICRVFFEEYEVAQFCLNQECLLRQVLAELD